MKFKFKPVFRLDKTERKFRLFRFTGVFKGAPYGAFSSKSSFALVPKLIEYRRYDYGFAKGYYFALMGVEQHYEKSFGGVII